MNYHRVSTGAKSNSFSLLELSGLLQCVLRETPLMHLSLFFLQHHGEGCESSAAPDQLQSPQHALPQRQATGQSLVFIGDAAGEYGNISN